MKDSIANIAAPLVAAGGVEFAQHTVPDNTLSLVMQVVLTIAGLFPAIKSIFKRKTKV